VLAFSVAFAFSFFAEATSEGCFWRLLRQRRCCCAYCQPPIVYQYCQPPIVNQPQTPSTDDSWSDEDLELPASPDTLIVPLVPR
jgi:hypothetical protein